MNPVHARLKSRFFPSRRSIPLLLLILVIGELFRVVGAAQAERELPSQDPTLPPEEEAGLEWNRPPWREPTPTLEDVFLPDLQTLPPFDLQLVVNRRTGERVIRFSNSVWNAGEGVLELRGLQNSTNKTIEVSQYLYGFDQDMVKRRVSEFVYHPEHNHWHWEDFSIYEIWTVEPDGELGELLVTSGKLGYCMLDISRAAELLIQEHALSEFKIPDRRQYGQCGWRRQGISAGWVDTYDSDTPGQVMDVTRLQDGFYALRSIVDPNGILYESDSENNSAVVYFALAGNLLLVIGEDPPADLPSDPHPFPLTELGEK